MLEKSRPERPKWIAPGSEPGYRSENRVSPGRSTQGPSEPIYCAAPSGRYRPLHQNLGLRPGAVLFRLFEAADIPARVCPESGIRYRLHLQFRNGLRLSRMRSKQGLRPAAGTSMCRKEES
jgi:hypothetical protein